VDAFPSAREQIGQENQQTRATTEQERMREFLQENSASILGVLRVYVQRMGLAHGSQVPEMALEIFQETASEVLAHAERFAGDAQPMPLLLGIAANMIRRRKVEQAKRFQREQLLSDVARRYPGIVDEDTLLDTLVPPAAPEPAQVIESNEEAAALLALVSPEDQRVLRLAILDGHQHTSLARELGTTPGTARMRLHRALSRLRAAWQTQQEKLQKETRHA
jgi:RNA polymerase sigma-70 factor (ECF subfamily)